MAEHHSPNHPTPGNPGYEVSDVSTPPIWKFLGYLFAVTFGSIALMYGMFVGLKSYNDSEEPEATVMEQQRSLPAGTRLQVNEPQDLKTFRTKEAKAISSYTWEDKSVNAVRIPVSRAMEIVAEKGLPKFEVPPVKGATGSAAARPAAAAKEMQ